MIRTALVPAVLFTALAASGCRAGDNVTAEEAREALDESTTSSQASALTSTSIEIATNFTLGQGLEQAAADVRTFVESQLPCASVTADGTTLSVTYGAKPGNCTYHGHTFSGTHTIAFGKDGTEVVVDHTWDALSNGVVQVDGSAHVVWSAAAEGGVAERHIQHELDWKRLADGRTGHGTGDRIQKPLADGLQEGIVVDGNRTWDGAQGRWSVLIEGVEMRWQDPVPQSGSYTLQTPQSKSLEVSFARVDDDTIAVTIATPRRDFTFQVTRAGAVSGD